MDTSNFESIDAVDSYLKICTKVLTELDADATQKYYDEKKNNLYLLIDELLDKRLDLRIERDKNKYE